MENASKALIIAGGMLLAIITLSLIVYMTTATGRIGKAQDEKKATEQLVAFNMQYEAYNKQVMYGTEVITVINKAIDHNKNMKSITTTDPYYINIKMITKEPFVTTGEKVNKKELDEDRKNSKTYKLTEDEIESITGKSINLTLEAGTHELGKWKKEDLFMNEGVVDFFSQDKKDIIEEDQEDDDIIYYIYSGLTNLKRAIFKCTNVHYNETTGRIDEMTFEQRLINN